MSTKNLNPEIANAAPLTPAAVQTSAYTAVANQYVPADASSAALSVTLTTTPADKSRVLIKKLDTSTNAVTVNAGGTATFNTATGPASVTLTLQNQSVTLQYVAATNIWTVIADGLPLGPLTASLASTYATKTEVALKAPVASPAFTGTPTGPTAATGTNTTQLATTAFAVSAAAAQSAADNAISSLGTVSATTLDLSAFPTGGVVLATLAANITAITFPATTATRAITLELVLTQDATGSRTLTFPTSVKSSDGNPPILSTTAGATDTVALVWDSVRWKVRLVERGLA